MVEETLWVTDEFCAKYRVLKREVEILQEGTAGFAECWRSSSPQ
jgi:hypothetical protein